MSLPFGRSAFFRVDADFVSASILMRVEPRCRAVLFCSSYCFEVFFQDQPFFHGYGEEFLFEYDEYGVCWTD